MTDYYLQDITRLQGQPKRTIADYVESQGILVPKRFANLSEARKSNKPILLRSEHPQEYDGVSGLLDSIGISPGCSAITSDNIEAVKQRYFEELLKEKHRPNYRRYCRFLGLDENEFIRQASFSIWEKVPGLSRTIVSDSAIPGRYHIMSCDDKRTCYTIVEDGQIIQKAMQLPEELIAGIPNLIETYEQVRNLARFDSNHCPIMEFQTFDGKNYFLQYHRTRDFEPATFTLDRALEDGEIEALFVRGATPKEGIKAKVSVYYADSLGNSNFNPEDEEGSFDFHDNSVFSELQFRRRKLQAISQKPIKAFIYAATNHSPRSRMFKPEVSAIIPIELVIKNNEVIFGDDNVNFGDGRKYFPRDPILKDGEVIFNFREESKKGHNSFMNLQIISDGRRAFIRRSE